MVRLLIALLEIAPLLPPFVAAAQVEGVQCVCGARDRDDFFAKADAAQELKVFTPRQGGVEHVGADNMSLARDYLADWFAETLGGASNGHYAGAQT